MVDQEDLDQVDLDQAVLEGFLVVVQQAMDQGLEEDMDLVVMGLELGRVMDQVEVMA